MKAKQHGESGCCFKQFPCFFEVNKKTRHAELGCTGDHRILPFVFTDLVSSRLYFLCAPLPLCTFASKKQSASCVPFAICSGPECTESG